MTDVFIVLDNVRSAYNVGAIFRTADGAGVKKIFLAGYTPTPIDRFGRVQPDIQKTSLGASEMVEWERAADVLTVVEQLKDAGVTVVALEQTPQSISLAQLTRVEKIAYVFGNEITGVSSATCEACDYIVALPMLGAKESLNVSVAAGIVMYRQLLI